MSPRKMLALLAVLSALGPLASALDAQGPALDSEEKKTLYAVGLVLAQNMGPLGLTADELVLVEAGLQDAILGKPRIDIQEYGPKLNPFVQARSQKQAAKEKEAGQAFLEAEAAQEGAVKTASGLVIQEITAGEGASPGAADTVTVHYHGTLRDGRVFDSSVDRGEPATFPLNQVIACWTEGLQKMKVGGKSRLVCPSEIAYGDRGAPPMIAPGAALVFEVELLSIGGGDDS